MDALKAQFEGGELISMEAAYNVLTEYYHHSTKAQHEALRDALSRVPAAQSNRYKISRVEREDCISRQVAIDALGNAGIINYNATGDGNGMIQAINVIKAIPAAQPMRKKGKWVPIDDHTPHESWKCDKCGHIYEYEDIVENLPKFCPNCGAQMTEGEQP